MPLPSQARVFVSHSSENKPFVQELVHELTKHDVNVWFDELELQVGDSIVEKISEGLKTGGHLIVVLSRASVASQWVRAELNAALMQELSGKGTRVLPVLIEDCEPPPLLRDRLYADFRSGFQDGLEKLLEIFEPLSIARGSASKGRR